MENAKKISFGFNKFTKKSNIIINKIAEKEEKKYHLIEYLEEQSIKVIGGDEKIPAGPLVIPMKTPNKKLINLVDIVKNDFKESIEDNQEQTMGNPNTSKNEKSLTLDELAAKELLNDSTTKSAKIDLMNVIEVPPVDKLTFEGEKESTLDDYESIPVEHFGKAMLRGMGWKDGLGIGKNQKIVKMAQPVIRPKGMGLGADSITKKDSNTSTPVDRNGKVLTCVKGAYVKVIAGYHKGYYGQIMGFDDESGRFIIKLTLTNINVSLNEFLVTPVSKEEYSKNSKVLNNAKYEEYMKKKERSEELKNESEKCDLELSDKAKHYKHRNKKVNIKKEPNSASSDDENNRRKKDALRIKAEHDNSDTDRENYKTSRKKSSDSEIEKTQNKMKYVSKKINKKDRDGYENNYKEKRDKERYENQYKQRSDKEIDDGKKYEDKYPERSDKYSKKDKHDNAEKQERKSDSSKKKYSDESCDSEKKSNVKKLNKSGKKDRYKESSDSEEDRNTKERKNCSKENTIKEHRRHNTRKRYSGENSDSDEKNKVNKSGKSKKRDKYNDSSNDDEERYEKKSRKHRRNKKYDNYSDSDADDRLSKKFSKSNKKDKHRDRSRHSTKDKRK